jgi:hypothetical protein
MTHPNDVSSHQGKNLVFFYEASEANNKLWLTVARYYDVWHTIPVRSEYHGTTMFRFNNKNRVMAVASYSRYNSYSSNGKVFTETDFAGDRPTIPHSESILQTTIADSGVSCATWCSDKYGANSKCDLFRINDLNNCVALKQYFQCNECTGSVGSDQPALEVTENRCLHNTGARKFMTTCEAFHVNTKRLCACFDPTRVKVYHDEWERIIANSQRQATEPFGV